MAWNQNNSNTWYAIYSKLYTKKDRGLPSHHLTHQTIIQVPHLKHKMSFVNHWH